MLLTQCGVIFFIATAAAIGLSLTHGFSVIAGGLAVILPTAVFAWRAFAHAGARSAQAIVRSFFAGEALKLILTALILAAIIALSSLPLGAVYSGFIAALATQWLAPVLFLKST